MTRNFIELLCCELEVLQHLLLSFVMKVQGLCSLSPNTCTTSIYIPEYINNSSYIVLFGSFTLVHININMTLYMRMSQKFMYVF